MTSTALKGQRFDPRRPSLLLSRPTGHPGIYLMSPTLEGGRVWLSQSHALDSDIIFRELASPALVWTRVEAPMRLTVTDARQETPGNDRGMGGRQPASKGGWTGC